MQWAVVFEGAFIAVSAKPISPVSPVATVVVELRIAATRRLPVICWSFSTLRMCGTRKSSTVSFIGLKSVARSASMAPGGVVRLQTTCAGVNLPQSWPASCCIAAALASPRRCKARVETPGGMRAMPGGGQQVENGGLGSVCTQRTMPRHAGI